MNYFRYFCDDCLDKDICDRDYRYCPYFDYYEEHKKWYDPYIFNNHPGLIRNKKTFKIHETRHKVLKLIREGCNVTEIAERLQKQERGIRHHIEKLYKLGMIKNKPTYYNRWEVFWRENDNNLINLYRQGNSLNEISRKLKKVSPGTIKKRLVEIGVICQKS